MAEAKSQIAFEQAGLGNILNHHQLVVPPNQREYSWDTQVKQMFQDFAKAIGGKDQGYFLGTLVTIPRMNGNLEVVDGQQRLATTAILLAAIRDYLKERGEDVLVESINNEFLTGIDRDKRTRVAKLKLNVDDNELFNWIIARSPKDPEPEAIHESHRLLKGAYEEARAHVKRVVATLDPKDHGDLLNGWVSFVQHRALVVLLKVPSDANAYKMFETLNDRGLRTSQADLIKNYLFGQSGERIQETQKRWTYMRGTLATLDEDDITVNFLRHALIVTKGFVREAQVYETVQEAVNSEQSAVTFASALENLASAYVATFNPDHEKWNTYPDAARRGIEVFNLFNIKPMRPLLLAITSKMDVKEAAKAIQYLVSLGVRLVIAATTRSGSVEVPLATASHEVFSETIKTAAALKAKLADITPSQTDFHEAFQTARVSSGKLARYYLRSLEMAAKGESEPWFFPLDDKSIINLEHVLPKKPEANWPQFDDDALAAYAARIGNMVLMRASDNAELRSSKFADKKAVYAKSPYLLTSQVAECAEWTAAQIVTRQKTLADLALKAWPI